METQIYYSTENSEEPLNQVQKIAGQLFMAKQERRIRWFSYLLAFARQDGIPGPNFASRLYKSLVTRVLQ